MKIPRGVNGPQAKRVLERLGFVATRQVGSHLIMKKGELSTSVPQHSKAIKVGTLARILKQAAVSPEQFVESL